MNLAKLLKLDKEQLIALDPKDVQFFINDEGIVHIAKILDAYWQYDYEAARKGKPGYHALLKSLRHSDGFFASRILLQYPNILEIMSFQMVYRYRYYRFPMPDWVAGIPDGATKLGEKIAEMMGVRVVEMEKVDGKIKVVSNIPPLSEVLLVEDFCTKGTGFKEAVSEINIQRPLAKLLPYELVLLNRGGMNAIIIEGIGPFQIVAAAYYPVDDWEKKKCPICKEFKSKPIKPKVTDENWQKITTAQSLSEREIRTLVTAKICGN